MGSQVFACSEVLARQLARAIDLLLVSLGDQEDDIHYQYHVEPP